ncbi:MAG TPA: SGNH/GDSL hydrolase family protein [Chroococcales cyanobacterium]
MSADSKTFPVWALFSLAANGLLVVAIAWVQLREDRWSIPSPVSQSVAATHSSRSEPDSALEPGSRLHLNYQQWVDLLGREAEVAAVQQPKHLSVLLGDSLSLWFPTEVLPSDRHWLNQGISGETSAGLLNRLELIDQTQPEIIYVMIGINDLIRGVRDQTILANQELIVRYLQRVHPQAKIVVQSILPHSADKVTWEGRDRLLAIPNSRIQELNGKLKAIAEAEGAIYLDLYPLFADTNGNLKTELSTDGLHLSPQGYLVWRNAMLVLNELLLGKS